MNSKYGLISIYKKLKVKDIKYFLYFNIIKFIYVFLLS